MVIQYRGERYVDIDKSDNCYHIVWQDKTTDYFPKGWFTTSENLTKQFHNFKSMSKGRPAFCNVLIKARDADTRYIEIDYSKYSDENDDAGCSLGSAHFLG